MLEPSGSKEAWREWRAGVSLDALDGECLAVLPLLSGRLREWLPTAAEQDPEREIVLGICKRGWAQNQMRYRETADIVNTLRQAGVDPIAIFGPLAWALLYAEEKAVRPIETLDILIHRSRVIHAAQALEAAGWSPEPGMPVLEGPVFDKYAGIWCKSRSGSSLHLAWRLWNASPELAQSHEATPRCTTVDLQGTQTHVVPTEELLLDALTRERDHLVIWQCDAAVLLRNRRVDWRRLRAMSRSFSAAAARLEQIRNKAPVSIPPGILDIPQLGPLRLRWSTVRADYRRVSWAVGRNATLRGFAVYAWNRLFRRSGAHA